MATIAQREIFTWKEIEKLGDLERLRLVLEYLPDERLMRLLEAERGKGRDDYPVRAVWNSILAGVVYEHKSIESLRRELKRNTRLCWLCGFELTKDNKIVPPAWVYTRFLKKLMRMQEEVDWMFDKLVEDLRKELPGLGKHLAMDGKALRSAARRRKEENAIRDGRRDLDADKGVKSYWVEGENGSLWKRVKSWFGYKLHLVVDATYELPVAYEITKASRSEIPEGKKLIKGLKKKHPGIIGACEHMMADRGLDDTELNQSLWDKYGIKPVIDIRNMWKDGEKTRLVEGTSNVVYDYKGTVYCYDMRLGRRREMAYGGFESDRNALKYRCPKDHYGCRCHWASQCEIKKAVRIKLNQDRRVFTPLARSSYKWKDYYKKRTAVERVNSRLDVSYGFEQHFIRGLPKMKLRMGLALVVMLSMALGRIKEKQKENMRSLVKMAA
jgi:hypothetical protein